MFSRSFFLSSILLLSLLLVPSQGVRASKFEVSFELVYESPSLLTFEVTTIGKPSLVGKVPLDILVEGFEPSKIQRVCLERLSKDYELIEEPIYKEVDRSYTSLYRNYSLELGAEDKSSGRYFIDYDLKGRVLFETSFESFDPLTRTIHWSEQELVEVLSYEREVISSELLVDSLEVAREPGRLSTTFPQLEAKDSKSSWGTDTQKFLVSIETDLLTSSGGWGSAGLLVWDINGTRYFDTENSSWWDNEWKYYREVTIDAAFVSEDLVDFPATIFLDETFEWDKVQYDGDDFRFLDSNYNNIPYEIDTLTWGDEAVFHVRVPEVDDTEDTVLYMFYGNATCSSGENKVAVWDSNFVAVYHMNDNPAGDGILDSTSNANHGTKGAGTAAPTEVDGLVGKAQSFDGGDDELIIPHSSNLSVSSGLSGGYTLEMLLNTSQAKGIYRSVISKAWFSPYGEWAIAINQGKLEAVMDGWKKSSGIDVNDGNDHVVGCYYTPNGKAGLFQDGSITDEWDVGPFSRTNTLGIKLGMHSTYYAGIKIETRISNTARGPGWISLTNSCLTNSGVISLGPTQGYPEPVTSFLATIDGNNVILSWALGEPATEVTIVRGLSSYPASLDDGVEVYSGSLETYTDEGVVTEFSTYYYSAFSSSAWGVNTEDFSTVSTGGAALLFIAFVVLGVSLLVISLWRRSLVFTIATSATWLSLGFIMLIEPTLLASSLELDSPWWQVLVFVPFVVATASILYYIAGIGKTKITMVDSSGKSWAMWGKAPSDKDIPRDRLVKQKHKERLKAIRSRRR